MGFGRLARRLPRRRADVADRTAGRISLGVKLGMEGANGFFVRFDRPGQEQLVLARAFANAVDKVVDLVDHRLEERLHLGGEQRQKLTQAAIRGPAMFCRKLTDTILSRITARLRDANLIFDGARKREDRVGVALQQVCLLIFKQTEQGAVFLHLSAQGFGNIFPGCTHSGAVVKGLETD